MSNFLIRSKDQYLGNLEKYPHFLRVFGEIDRMAAAKNYYDADLFNIEEILSIIEMAEFAESSREKSDFVQYVKDVIAFHTPKPEPRQTPANWQKYLFGPSLDWHAHAHFVTALLNVDIGQQE